MSHARLGMKFVMGIRGLCTCAAFLVLVGCGNSSGTDAELSDASGLVHPLRSDGGTPVAATDVASDDARLGAGDEPGSSTRIDAGGTLDMREADAGGAGSDEAKPAPQSDAGTQPVRIDDLEPPVTAGALARLVSGVEPSNSVLRAIGRMEVALVPDKICNGVLVRASDDADAPVYLLTSGSCALDPTLANRRELDLPTTVSFDRFHDGELDVMSDISATRVVFATLEGTNLALLALDRTRAELAARGLEPLKLELSSTSEGDPLRLVGAPDGDLTGSYDVAGVLRESRCEHLRTADVAEHHYVWFDETVSRCPGMVGSVDGAPVLDDGGAVVAVHHGVYGAAVPPSPCFSGSPCEIGDGRSERVEVGNTYASPLSKLDGCFDAGGYFDGALPDCRPAQGSLVSVRDKPALIVDPTNGDVWGGEIATDASAEVRMKVGYAANTDCRDEEGYSDPVTAETVNLALDALPMPDEEGLAVLCLVAGTGPVGGSGWSFDYPTVWTTRLYEHRARPSGPEVIDLTPQQAFDIAVDVMALFEEHARAANARLTASTFIDGSLTMDIREDREWRVEIGLNLMVPGRTTADVAAFLLCHEVGHAVGGFPFKQGPKQTRQVEGLANGSYGTVSSMEAQSDYFASKDCLPRLWANETEKNARFRTTVSEFVKSACDAVWETEAEQNICYRGAATAEAFGYWYAPEESLRVDTPEPSVVERTTEGRSKQCRVDTMFQASLCPKKLSGTTIAGLIEPFEQVLTISPEVEEAAAVFSCTEGVGSRPPCWFKGDVELTDCTGYPEVGRCVVASSGLDGIEYCTPKDGVVVVECFLQEQCVSDDSGSYCDTVTD